MKEPLSPQFVPPVKGGGMEIIMKLGCCVNMFANQTDPVGKRMIPFIAKNSYDYVELPLAQIMDYNETEFEELVELLKKEGIPCEACNNFFPASLKITGPTVDEDKIRDYIVRAVERAERLGAKRIVLGSSGAKNVPEGFDFDTAFGQIVNTCRIASEILKDKGILVVIEPLNHIESNIILNVTDGSELMKAADRPEITQLVDYYHHCIENESLEAVQACCSNIHHVHFADQAVRGIPVEEKEEYKEFLKMLKQNGYNERISIEALSDQPEEELPKALVIRNIWNSL